MAAESESSGNCREIGPSHSRLWRSTRSTSYGCTRRAIALMCCTRFERALPRWWGEESPMVGVRGEGGGYREGEGSV